MQKIIFTLIYYFLTIFSIWSQQKWDRPMQLKSCSIEIKADVFTATTFIEMEFYNPNNQEIEGLHRFALKPGQVITAFQLDLNGKYRDGSIEEKWKATNAYNTIVGKRIDPALLTMEYADHYNLRIYPMPAKSSRKITLSIEQLLTVENKKLHYSLPININDTVENFAVKIEVAGNSKPSTGSGLISDQRFLSNENYRLEWTTKKCILNKAIDFSIPILNNLAFCNKKIENKIHFALRFQPSSSSRYEIKPREITVLWDASASSAKRDVKKEINFLKEYILFHDISKISIIPFNYKVLDTVVFNLANNQNNRWQQYLHNITYTGATQLGIIDFSTLNTDIIFLFSDGSNTYGQSKPKSGTALIYCIYTSPDPSLKILEQISGYSGGSIIDLKKTSLDSAVNACSHAENWLIEISSASRKVSIESSLPVRAEGHLLINGTMFQATDTIFFHYGNNSGINIIEKIIADFKHECNATKIDRISMLVDFERIVRSNQWNDILEFGLKEKVVTPNTAYIVLERVEDYIKYNITPPVELEAECEKMNYVKRDTRFERLKISEADKFTILNNVVKIYNQRISRWDVNEKSIYFNRTDYDNVMNKTKIENISSSLSSNQQITGNVPGLSISNNALNEVVVVGYGSARRSSLTGSVAYISRKDIFSSANTIEQALQGKVAGVYISNSSGYPGSSSNISIRGIGSLNGNNQPLYVLDGIPVNSNINELINIHDINDITVLKDITATSIYGSRGANGVIIINSKKGRNYNYYHQRNYRLKDMEDVDYLQELKSVSLSHKLSAYEIFKAEYEDDPGFYFDAAQHLFEVGLKDDAFKILMNAAEAGNGSRQALLATAYILENWKFFNEAIKIYKSLVNDNVNDLSLQRSLAWALYQAKHYQEAVDVLFNSININTGQLENNNIPLKAMIMSEMNAIISIHKRQLNISSIPVELLKPLPVDMRIVVDFNKGTSGNLSISEPGGLICSYSQPVSKNGGIIQSNHHWYNVDIPFEYYIKNAKEGKYKININYYDFNSHNDKVPTMARLMTFKNFGKEDPTIEIANVILDNQFGEIEIAEIKF